MMESSEFSETSNQLRYKSQLLARLITSSRLSSENLKWSRSMLNHRNFSPSGIFFLFFFRPPSRTSRSFTSVDLLLG